MSVLGLKHRCGQSCAPFELIIVWTTFFVPNREILLYAHTSITYCKCYIKINTALTKCMVPVGLTSCDVDLILIMCCIRNHY